MKNKINVPTLPTNIGEKERLVSIISGSMLVLGALTGKKKKVIPALAGAYLLLRGGTGYCAVSDVAKKIIDKQSGDIIIETSIKVDKPVDELYTFWRRLENLPLFMSHLKNVEQLNNKISEWKAKIPGMPGSITWKAEIIKDIKNGLIAWRSLPGSGIENSGSVEFRDLGMQGSAIEVVIKYKAPAGKVGEKVAEWLNPYFEKIVQEDVKSFTSYLETANWKLAKV